MLSVLCAVTIAQQHPAFTVQITGGRADGLAAQISQGVKSGSRTVTAFFGKDYAKPFDVEIFVTRAALDSAVKKRWGMSATENWMVAMGVADKLFILSPRVWKGEGPDHDGDDPNHVQQILTHELTHVYHAQTCPEPEFEGMDAAAWFVEGLATYVAGQLDGRFSSAKQAIAEGKAPTKLEDAWTGRYRYGVAGSMVRYVDKTFGRTKLLELMKLKDNASMLKALGLSEARFIEGWRKSIEAG